MKRFLITLLVLFGLGMFLASCSEDKKTELQWTNGSDAAINTIVWSGDDTTWAKDDGYGSQTKTESKEIEGMTGEVNCAIYDVDDFYEASVTIEGENDNTLSLNEGESYTYTINAQPIAKKK